MRSTKLEEYIAIVTTLIVNGPLEMGKLESLSGIDESKFREDVVFLIKQSMIEQWTPAGVLPTFVASPLGIRVVKYFGKEPNKQAI